MVLAVLRLMLTIALGIAFSEARSAPRDWQGISSPDGNIVVSAGVDEGRIFYQVDYKGRSVIDRSQLGFVFKRQPALKDHFEIEKISRRSVDETWVQPWGESKNVRDYHNELRVVLKETTSLSRSLVIVFRVFNDGLGFRYEIPSQPSLKRFEIMDELTQFALAQNYTAWWIPAYRKAGGEYQYAKSAISSVKQVQTPLTMTGDGIALSIHEAGLVDYAGMNLLMDEDNSKTLKADLVPWSDGVRVYASSPMKTPWRTIQIAERPIGLLESSLNLNLNEPNKLGDVSWVRSQKYIGIWWGMHIGRYTWSPGPDVGATTERSKQYIDWAAAHGIPAVLVEGWNSGWEVGEWWRDGRSNFNFTKAQPDFDMDMVAKYAREKRIEIVGHHETGAKISNYLRQMEDAFAYYERQGVHTIKMGHVGTKLDSKEWPDSQFGIRYFQRVLDTAAKHHIAIISHEPVKDAGLRRTYPNLLSREGARGQEYNGGSPDTGNLPDHTAILPYTRMLAGPFDYTPGVFNFDYQTLRPINRVPTTLAHQLALYVVLYSPVQMACDLPENYEGQPAFKFIQDVPTDWEFTRPLAGEVGESVAIARKDRAGDDWYLGAITNEDARTLSIPLSFLDADREYLAEFYVDGAGAHWKTDPGKVAISSEHVDSQTVLNLSLAAGGGQAIRFHPLPSADSRP